MIDIYFEQNYGKLYEEHDEGKSEVFEYKSSYGTVRNLFIKREIPSKIDGEKYYDIITPYGYGGPVITSIKDQTFRGTLIKDFIREFKVYSHENNIVSEFIRFHPLIKNAFDFSEFYDVVHIRNTVGTDLKTFEDPFQSEFSRSCRRNVRRALRNDVTFKITERPEDISKFKEIYYSTMDRNKASDYYYFDEEYFNNCLKYFRDNLLIVEAIYEEQVIAMGFYFIYNDYIHIHLSGTLSDYLKLSPAYILRYGVTKWGKENGYKLIHHGGGTTNDPEDSLYRFKKQFGANTDFEFHIGSRIWNSSIYDKLCQAKNIDKDTDFFPAYRFNEK